MDYCLEWVNPGITNRKINLYPEVYRELGLAAERLTEGTRRDSE